MKNKYSVFMDIDGVLFNTYGPLRTATKRAFKTVLNYDMPDFEFLWYWGKTWKTLRNGIRNDRKFSFEALTKVRVLRNSLLKWPAPNPVAKSFLKANLDQVVLCTSGSQDTTMAKIAKLKMPELPMSRVLCAVEKNYDFWYAGAGQHATLVIDDSMGVIMDAERAGKQTIHWRQFNKATP